jgi:ligand-binding sensor domain-containing protein
MQLILQTLLVSLAALSHPLASAGIAPAVERTVGHFQEATCLVELEAEVWAGTRGGGLVRVGSDGLDVLDASRGLPGNRVNDCVVVGDVLWVATDVGLANLDVDGDAFEVWEYGRFLRVADAGGTLVAARDDGVALRLDEGDEPGREARVQLDMTVLSLAGSPDGSWAAGGMDGKVVAVPPGKGPGTVARLGFPVTALAFRAGTLHALVPGAGFRLERGRMVAEPGLAGAVALTREGEPLVAPELAAVQVNAALHAGNRWYAATDESLLHADNGSHDWQPAALGGCPCGPRLSALASFRGDLWVGGFDSGLCRFDGRRWHHYRAPAELPSDMVNHMAVGRDRLYVATLKGLAVVDSRGRFTLHTREQCVDNTGANCPWYESVTGVAADPVQENIWIADTGSLHRWSSRKWKHLYRQRGIVSERITRVAARNGMQALGTSDRGILLREHGKDFRTLDDQQGLADNWVMDLDFDRSGALWIATCTRGISRYKDGHWQTWTTADGLTDDYTLTIAEIDGRIWVGHFRGISILTEQGIRHLRPSDGLAGAEVHDILQHDGKVYLATDGGLTVVGTGAKGEEENGKETKALFAAGPRP